jgi:ribonuclease HI
VDGASRNNPGPAAYGVVIRRPDGAAVRSLSRYIGVKTNNEAEYLGLVAALDYATRQGITKLRVRSDSELLVRQMQGRYKVRSASLRLLHEQARKLARHFAYLGFEHVPREQNVEADRLANGALDRAAPGGPRPVSRTIRARYSRGVLIPGEPVELAEGEEIEITIRKLVPEPQRRKS